MAKSKSHNPQGKAPQRKPKKTHSMFTDLHADVSKRLQLDGLTFVFHPQDDDRSCSQEYETFVMGRFECHNAQCRQEGWSSKKIAIVIRMYNTQRYNARVYHQRCRSCKQLSRPILDVESYIDRVTYRLKKWSGIEMEVLSYTGRTGDLPHASALCEGCKAGRCQNRRTGLY
ncbi:uncharacterized protein J7T54_003033 [Emericellopsis cladophorae]|uniref:3CxxC-type domain-containing protein n=1 Tax=Emericellopsis cladophorae TaxID=2686198 RepID=A0A9P9XZN7_9HYPO|nr:uncharacterized protein J7T54_003033 [Emericellopsis cladophorae]KAI6780254.1 hypothetical protein J7T54_003033 [Emericellopsis cladophorae]